MKNISFLILFSFSFTFVSFAQDFRWAEEDAVWHHSYNQIGYSGYQKTEWIKDTLIEGQNCQKLINQSQQSSFDQAGQLQISPLETVGIYFLQKRVDSILVYRDGAFHLAFKTNAQANDIWDLGTFQLTFPVHSNRAFVKVDSVFYEDYNGVSLRNIRVHACDENGTRLENYWEAQNSGLIQDTLLYPSFTLINEKFGYLDGFGFYGIDHHSNTIYPDERMPQKLVCYESETFSAYLADGEVDCFSHTFDNEASLNELELSQIKIYPNPSKNAVFFENLPAGGKMQVFNLQQQLIFQSDFTETTTTIDVSHFASGMYFVQVSNSNGEKETGLKFVKE